MSVETPTATLIPSRIKYEWPNGLVLYTEHAPIPGYPWGGITVLDADFNPVEGGRVKMTDNGKLEFQLVNAAGHEFMVLDDNGLWTSAA